MSLQPYAQLVLGYLDDKLYGLEKQERELRNIVTRWADSRKGDSCVITGSRGSGRSTIVRNVLNDVHVPFEFEQNFIHVAQFASDATVHDAFQGDQNIPRVIIIEDSDELTCRTRQTLLYSILTATRDYPWLVLLMVNSHDFLGKLEKRVRSRLSSANVKFNGALQCSEFMAAARLFLTGPEEMTGWNYIIDTLLRNQKVPKDISYVMQVSNSYSSLKTICAMFLLKMSTKEADEQEIIYNMWDESICSVASIENPIINVLKNISLRTLCVLLCIYRRLKHFPHTGIPFNRVCGDYHNLCTDADSRMKASSTIVFKEIDRLIDLGICTADTKTNNISFRRVSLLVDIQFLEKSFSELKIPTTIDYWVNKQVEK